MALGSVQDSVLVQGLVLAQAKVQATAQDWERGSVPAREPGKAQDLVPGSAPEQDLESGQD